MSNIRSLAGAITGTVSPTQRIKIDDPSPDVAQDYKDQVKQFRQNLPQFQDQLFQGAASQARSQLAGQMADITSGTNRRGLLYGGIHNDLNNQARAGAAAGLAQQRLNINNFTQGLADQFENQQLNQALEKYRGDVDYNQKMYNLAQQQQANDYAKQAGLIGGIGSLVGAGAGLATAISDENLKENITDGDSDAKDLLKNISTKSYDYKNAIGGEGRHLSPMAQDLEKSAVGKSMVLETPLGKVVDYGKGFGAIMAVQKYLDKRLEKLEAKK